MMKYLLGCFCLLSIWLYAQQRTNTATLAQQAGTKVATRFVVPETYGRKVYAKGSFGDYLQQLALQPVGSKVLFYNGDIKPNQKVAAAVLTLDVGKKDLQQCADAVMRLRAEYLFAQKKYTAIHFNFTSGFVADYVKWAEGQRIKVKGNTCTWYNAGESDYSYKNFRQYLDIIFCYAGTLSLSKEMKKAKLDSIEVGDVFIKGGSPGHAVIVVDMAIQKSTGKRIFMLAQSYMPAQSMHVLVNENNGALSPWYETNESDMLYTPEWTFNWTDLKRF